MKTRGLAGIISGVLSVAMMVASMPINVSADDGEVEYIDRWQGESQYKSLTADEYSLFPESGGTITTGTYVVDKDISIFDRVVISGTVKIILCDGHTLTCKNGITVSGTNTLYVYGQSKETGTLETLGYSSTMAGIGGDYNQSGGTMHFCSGTVIAKAGSSAGAGIGGGYQGDAGNINIHGGNITATGGTYGAGIGGGDNGYGGTVNIWGGNVVAKGGEFAAGIGSGDEPGDRAVMTVNIYRGIVEATGGDEGAGIGGGNEGRGATVNISGNEFFTRVTAKGGNDDVGEGAGIGGGDEGDGGVVTISGGYVEAWGGHRAAGIGGGCDGSNTRVFIKGGEVHSFGGGVKDPDLRQSGGAGIGGGAYGYGGVIIITGGSVEANAYYGGAAIGGGYGDGKTGGGVTTIAISDANVRAVAENGGAAIGSGHGGDAMNISISSGQVYAETKSGGSSYGAGAAIGSGDGGYVANLNISGGTIKALSEFGNNGAAAIGGGNEGYIGNITISGGTIESARAYGGAGIGSGSGSEKSPDRAVGKITITGGTLKAKSVVGYSNLATGAGIGSGSYAVSPVHIDITGGTIEAYCGSDDTNESSSSSGAAIGSGYGSPMGLIKISGGTIKATRGKKCKKADPIGFYNDIQNSVYPNITFDYDDAQIISEKGSGTGGIVTNTQYDDNINMSRRLALLENETNWVEIKPCDHQGASYSIVSEGETGTHKISCDYCLIGNEEQVHKFNENNTCACGYTRYSLTFTDGQNGGRSKTTYVYPDLDSDGKVVAEKEIKISDYAPDPGFIVAGKEFTGWKSTDDDSIVYQNNYNYTLNGDTTLVAQWKDLVGLTIVLSSIDGPVAQLNAGEHSDSDRIADILAEDSIKSELDDLIASEGSAYIAQKDLVGRPSYIASKPLSDFKDLDEFQDDLNSNATIADLGDSHIIYVAMFKPIDKVDISIKAPVCGTEISMDGLSSTNPPQFAIPESQACSVSDTPFMIGWLKSEDPRDVFTGTIRGGNEYHALGMGVILGSYGYIFTDDTDVVVKGGTIEESEPSGTLLSIIVKTEAVHDWSEWEETKKATCDQNGEERRECKADGCSEYETRTIPLDPDAHDYSDPVYEWSDDNSKVTARRVCQNDLTHVEEEISDTVSVVVKEPTCTESGKTKYTAVFNNEAFMIQSRTLENIAPIGHDWGKWAYKDDEQHQRVCANDPSHIETEDHVWGEWKETKAPDVGTPGQMERTCSICDHTETKDIPALSPTSTPTPTAKATVTPTPKATTAPTPKATVTPTPKATTVPTPKVTVTPTKAATVSLKLNKKTAEVVAGKTMTLKATLKGSESKISWKSSDSKICSVDSNGKVTAKQAGTATIIATAAGKSAKCKVTVLFKDVTDSGSFWYKPVNYLTAKGIVKGYYNGTMFEPANHEKCTRAQMVTFIWRLAGSPNPKTTKCKFKDVKKTDYFYKACLWGSENKIVEGYGNGTFGPNIVCARRHAVTFLWRLAGKPAPKTSKNKFSDVKKTDYFYKATLWTSEKKILVGYSDGTFRPDADCYRRQMATFLYKYDKFINGKG